MKQQSVRRVRRRRAPPTGDDTVYMFGMFTTQ